MEFNSLKDIADYRSSKHSNYSDKTQQTYWVPNGQTNTKSKHNDTRGPTSMEIKQDKIKRRKAALKDYKLTGISIDATSKVMDRMDVEMDDFINDMNTQVSIFSAQQTALQREMDKLNLKLKN